MKMFIGSVTKFNGKWVIELLDEMAVRRDVEDKLKDLARKAIDEGVPLIWLYWPYSQLDHAEDILDVLRNFEADLKYLPAIRRKVRRSEPPTRLVHDVKAQMAVLHIKASIQ